MTESSMRELLAEVRRLLPFEDDSSAERVLDDVLRALAARLTDDERAAVATELPAPLRPALLGDDAVAVEACENDAAFFAAVARRSGLPPGRAAEHATGACRAVGQRLSRETVARLQRALPALATLFEQPAPSEPPAEYPRNPDSLAEGRPGSRHPLAGARPASGRATERR